MYYRNSIVKQFRANPSKKLTFTEARKTLVGDVGSIRRVFDFLEAWGLVNYSPSAHNKPLKWEDKESKSDAKGGGGGAASTVESSAAAASNRESSNKVVCSGCKLVCSIACFACDKVSLVVFFLLTGSVKVFCFLLSYMLMVANFRYVCIEGNFNSICVKIVDFINKWFRERTATRSLDFIFPSLARCIYIYF
jgi:hypothetical protein